ncbi:peptidylprolyl isomerase [Periweissella beninensis]|uniref:peptidylprolyl isomerase n=1 Tax=Periweissella beninensis TaxID=504936 RepID=UPI0021A774E6|nr:peptidylprolyl isomerase [Periweissella beninensis]MCT4396878.1 peptidylprolyl isomerase [Periweissella beninensis]
MKKAVLGVAAVLTATLLAACGDKTVATIDGGKKITQSQYYSSLKSTDSGKQVLSNMIINNALEAQYGDKVTTKEVNKQFNAYKKQYGSQFSTQLTSSGLTASGLKQNIRTQKLLAVAMKATTKITQKELETQFKSYQPKVTVRYILLKNSTAGKKTAQKVISQLNKASNKKASFIKLAKKYSTDSSTASNGGLYTAFDNTDTSTDSTFKEASFKLAKGEYTKTPVHSSSYGYFVIYMDNRTTKPKTITAAVKKTLKEQIYATDMNNSTKVSAVITKVLKKADPQIKDSDLSNVLSQYLSSSSSSSSSK